MPKKTPRKPKLQPIREQNEPATPFDEPTTAEPPPMEATAAETQPEAPPEPAAKPKGRGDPTGKQMNFFDRVGSIPYGDWGTRAKIKIYRLDPIIDRTRGSEYKFVQIYHAAVDEDKIKNDHGSGRYRLYLNVKNAGERNEKELDSIEIDILDPKFPPNIPAGEWVDDPRNKKWAWARPAGAPGGPPVEAPPTPAVAAAAAANQFIEGVKIAGEIRKQVRDENPAPAPAQSESTSLAGTLQLVTTIMGMKAENPMNEVYRDEMRALRDELKEERAENRRLMERRNAEPEKKFGLREAIGELKEVLPTVKDLLPQVSETVRAGRTNWIDVAQSIAPGVIDWAGKIAYAFAARNPAPMMGQQPNSQPHQQAIAAPNGNGQPAAPQPPQEVPAFVKVLSQPTALNSFQRYFAGYKSDSGQTGGDFANWIFDAEGIEPLKSARAMGTSHILALLKQSAFWPVFASDEAKLVQFIDDALAWQPPADEPEEDDEEEAVDLTRKGV